VVFIPAKLTVLFLLLFNTIFARFKDKGARCCKFKSSDFYAVSTGIQKSAFRRLGSTLMYAFHARLPTSGDLTISPLAVVRHLNLHFVNPIFRRLHRPHTSRTRLVWCRYFILISLSQVPQPRILDPLA